MGKQLEPFDILGTLAKEEEGTKQEPNPQADQPKARRNRRTITREPRNRDIAALKEAAAGAAAGKPSPFKSDLRQKLRQKKQFTFSEIPTFIADEFDRLRNDLGMTKREYLYHLLREQGADIPPYEMMDGRKL